MTDLTLPTPGTLTTDDGRPDPLRIAAGWLAGYAPGTAEVYWRNLKAFAAWVAVHDLEILEVTRAHIDLYARERLADGEATATVSLRLTTLSGYFRYAVDEGLLDRNPVDRVRRPKVPDTSPREGLDRTEAIAMLAAADRSGPRDAAVIGLLLLNGLRASEIGTLDVDALGIDRGHRILLVAGKGGRLDTVPIAPRLAATLDEHLELRTSGPLVLANDGDRLTRHRVRRIVARIARAAGIVDRTVCPHDLRHAACTHALAAGVELHRVQDAMRHASPVTTQRYNRARFALDGHATYALVAHLSGEVAA